jgi:DNA replication protein DnaC
MACPHAEEDRAFCSLCAADAKVAGGDVLAEWKTTRAEVECDRRFPKRFLDAKADHPKILNWVEIYRGRPDAQSLLIAGPTGVGKTWQAYGALRAAVCIPSSPTWQASTFADFTAALRPGAKDPEGSLATFRSTGLLLIDDLGAAKNSEWVEEITYRLLNGRYEDVKPSIFTTNLPLPELRAQLGDRLASRLVEMCAVVSMEGADRRRTPAAA